jgi:cellulose synthase operon protein C
MFTNHEHAERAHRFADGELEPGEAAKFRRHLGDCLECQQELQTVLLLRGRALDLLASRSSLSLVPLARARGGASRWRRARVAAVSGALAVAAAALLVTFMERQRAASTASALAVQAFDHLAREGHRPFAERLTYPAADRYRQPPAVMRAARPAAVAPIETVSALRARGDGRGELALWLWAGDLDEAGGVVSPAGHRPGDDPDLDNDLAVLAMRQSRLEPALALLNGILHAHPHHRQARWNRALLLERRNDIAGAIRDFRAVVGQGEPGWSEEAEQRARRLTATLTPAPASGPAVRGPR